MWYSPLRTLQEANDIFPGNTNMDLIFGRPCQTPDSWLRELNEVMWFKLFLQHKAVCLVKVAAIILCTCDFFLQALTLCGNHMSLYQLTVEQGTPLAKALKNEEMVCQFFGENCITSVKVLWCTRSLQLLGNMLEWCYVCVVWYILHSRTWHKICLG